MKDLGVFLGFAPWIVFSVISGPSTWEVGALTALAVSLVLGVPGWVRDRSVGALDVGSTAFFVVLSVLVVFCTREQLVWVEDRAQLLSAGAITLIALVSLAVGHPFTEHYARRSTPREYWDKPLFRRVNVVITAVWTLVFALHVVLDLVVLAVPGSATLGHFVLPALLLVGAVEFTRWYPDHARSQAGVAAHGAHESGTVRS